MLRQGLQRTGVELGSLRTPQFWLAVRTATKKAVGSTKNGRDSLPKYLGVKKFGSEWVKPGNVLVRQRGTKYHAGDNVYLGKDHTLHAQCYGRVRFAMGKIRRDKQYVHVDPVDVDPAILADLKYKRTTRKIT